MSLLTAESLTVRYGKAIVLNRVYFHIDPGETITIVGPNGSGKWTLIRAFVGTVAMAEGKVSRNPNLRIGYVPQRSAIDAQMPMTVRRFLCLPTRQTAREIAAVVDMVSVAGLEQRQMTGLSGGGFQPVLLARALLARLEILILDEPTQGLDQPGASAFYRLIEDVRNRTGAAVLMVSHDLHVVMSASDRVICLNGHVCCEGTPTVVSAAPEYRALFGLGTGGALALYRHAHDHDHALGDDHHHHDHAENA